MDAEVGLIESRQSYLNVRNLSSVILKHDLCIKFEKKSAIISYVNYENKTPFKTDEFGNALFG